MQRWACKTNICHCQIPIWCQQYIVSDTILLFLFLCITKELFLLSREKVLPRNKIKCHEILFMNLSCTCICISNLPNNPISWLLFFFAISLTFNFDAVLISSSNWLLSHCDNSLICFCSDAIKNIILLVFSCTSYTCKRKCRQNSGLVLYKPAV